MVEEKPPEGEVVSKTAPRAALLLAVASLAMLPFLGLGAVPGMLLALAAWVLAHRTLARAENPQIRSLARMAFFLALAGTLLHGMLLILYLAKIVHA